MNVKQAKEEILDYWYIVEFLNQSAYPNFKNNTSGEYVTIGHSIYENTDLFRKIDQDYYHDKKFPIKSDNVEICMGKIARDDCVRAIYQLANVSDERVDNTRGAIAIMGLQISILKRYITGSFNLSPIIWMIYKMSKNGSKELAKLINEKEYESDLKEIENWLMKQDEVNMSILDQCYHKVIEMYVKPIFADIAFEGVFAYQRFKDDSIKEKYEEVLGYSNLHMNFFSQDLKFVKEQNHKNTLSNTLYGKVLVEPYIVNEIVISNNQEYEKRINILEDSNDSRKSFEKVLNISNAPLGKWPSRYAPALMQQFAINLSVSECPAFPPFLSVNGPPGTGKTTMLKEVIADSIVKKAIVMCSYSDANLAFTECNYDEGNMINNGYNKFYSHFYQVDEKINQYSILVASCNNTAVENITRELPDGVALCEGLKNKNDIDENEMRLQQIRNCFDAQKEDIYYTNYANILFNKNIKNDADKRYYWGLISVPLGNRKNQGNFTNILSKIFSEKLKRNQYLEEHKDKYAKAIVLFQKQLRIVNQIKESLERACNAKKELLDYITIQQSNKKISEENIKKYNNLKDLFEENIKKEILLQKQLQSSFEVSKSEVKHEKEILDEKKETLLDLQKKRA